VSQLGPAAGDPFQPQRVGVQPSGVGGDTGSDIGQRGSRSLELLGQGCERRVLLDSRPERLAGCPDEAERVGCLVVVLVTREGGEGAVCGKPQVVDGLQADGLRRQCHVLCRLRIGFRDLVQPEAQEVEFPCARL